jgi:hypothetical protein
MLFRNKIKAEKIFIKDITIKNPYLILSNKKHYLNYIKQNNNNYIKNKTFIVNNQKYKFSNNSKIDDINNKYNLELKDFSNFNDFHEKMKINLDSINKYNSNM